MAPRQRIIVAQPQDQDDQNRKLLVKSGSFDSDSSTSSASTDSGSTACAGKPLTIDEESNEAYIARTHHDYFNLVALVSSFLLRDFRV